MSITTPTSFTASSVSFEDSDESTVITPSHRDESGADILEHLRSLEDVVYLGDKDIVGKCDSFFDKTVNGNVVIRKGDESPKELLFAGIFEVDARNFFMTSDAKFNPSSTPMRFEQIKPHCHLLPVRRCSQFAYSANDFSTVVSNIQAVEKMVSGRKGQDDVSIVVTSHGTPTGIKLSHQLFKVTCLIVYQMGLQLSLIFVFFQEKKEENEDVGPDG